MKIRRRFFHGKDAYGPRKHVIERAHEIWRGNWRFDSNGGDLGQCVDAGVGASGALRQRFFTGQLFESGHQCPLNGHTVRLDLPSGEVMAIVSEREFKIAWQNPHLTLFNAIKQR
jgi:hypothetical protein